VAVKLFERDARRCERISEILKKTVVIHADGSDQATLEQENIRGAAEVVTVEHGGQTPDSMEALIALPGVARKTANVVLGNAMGINAGVCVDTHVGRLSRRLGLTEHEDPVKVERDLMDLFPRKRWTMIAHLLIWHGRRVCQSRKPACDRCELVELCPKIGVAAAT